MKKKTEINLPHNPHFYILQLPINPNRFAAKTGIIIVDISKTKHIYIYIHFSRSKDKKIYLFIESYEMLVKGACCIIVSILFIVFRLPHTLLNL